MLVWSAGCSTGEEPYTLAIVLSEYALDPSRLPLPNSGHRHLHHRAGQGRVGVYTSDVVARSRRPAATSTSCAAAIPAPSRVRVVPELRRLVEFRRLNFMDADYGLSEKADAIFCRNVIIYFDRATQERILQKLSSYLVPRRLYVCRPRRNPARYESAA